MKNFITIIILFFICAVPANAKQWQGKVSYYSEAGCLGCNAALKTASGETFDDDKFTLAFNHLPMRTMVKVTNLDTGKTIIAKVNDRGGFEKYQRIADLSIGLAKALGVKTDRSNILIETIEEEKAPEIKIALPKFELVVLGVGYNQFASCIAL